MTSELGARIGAALDRRVHPAITAYAARLAEQPGSQAVLFYGSNLRTGSLEGVIDFYLLTGGAAEKGLWPLVSYQEWEHEGAALRAKIATMTLAKFERACRGETLDTTIWARFVQPSTLVWAHDSAARVAVSEALAQAARTAARLAVAAGPEEGREDEYWRALFRTTYRAELRVEKPGREESIIAAHADHFDGLLTAALAEEGVGLSRNGDRLQPRLDPARRRAILAWWKRRRRWGKALNLARLVRATRTFEGAGRYAAWKLERHTGIEVELTPWRERHPLLAAPKVLWEVLRARRRAG